MMPKANGELVSDPKVRERLLSAALDLFVQKGYASTSVREIVESAGVTKPALYYYFENKEGVYLELIQRAYRQFEAIVEDRNPGGDSCRDAVKSIFCKLLDLFRANLSLVKFVNSIYYGPPQGAPPLGIEALHLSLHKKVRDLLESGMKSGEIKQGDPDIAMWAVLGILNMATDLEICHPELSIGENGLRRAVDAVFDGVSVTDGAGRKVKR